MSEGEERAADPLTAFISRSLRAEVTDVREEILQDTTEAELDRVFFTQDGASRTLIVKRVPPHSSLEVKLLPHLAPEGFILSAQNGLNELLIAERAGDARTMGCFVNFGADWLGPGHILYGGRGEVVVGEIDGPPRPRTVEMHELLKIFEPNSILTDNIFGYLWGKLAFAAMLFATALNNDTMDDNFGDPQRFPVFDRLGREVMAVARARQVTPLSFTGFDPAAFMPGSPESAARECIAVLSQRRRNSFD